MLVFPSEFGRVISHWMEKCGVIMSFERSTRDDSLVCLGLKEKDKKGKKNLFSSDDSSASLDLKERDKHGKAILKISF